MYFGTSGGGNIGLFNGLDPYPGDPNADLSSIRTGENPSKPRKPFTDDALTECPELATGK